jgi:glycosyltransferase involved in cell wall biosynthesis
VTVVTPVFNGEAYLSECIDSVLAQTYEHWELSIVNNASTDGSLDVARTYAELDPRIRVHDNERFLPQLENFNAALTRVPPASKYCKMVLADDRIHATCLERMVGVAESSSSVAIVGSYLTTERKVLGGGLPTDRSTYSGRDVCRYQLLTGNIFFGSPTAQLWRTEVVSRRDPFFRIGAMHADTEACYEILAEWDYGFVHEVLSFWRTENDSILNRVTGYNFYLVLQKIMLARYGPDFLTAKELAVKRHALSRRYERFLARSLLEREGEAFWAYHRRAVAEMGESLSRGRLARMASWAVLDLLLNPMRTWDRIRGRSARREEAALVESLEWGEPRSALLSGQPAGER